MRNTYPSEVESMNNFFENNKKKSQNNEMHYSSPKTMQFSTQKKKLSQINLSPLKHPL
jgi:hypothetical protein